MHARMSAGKELTTCGAAMRKAPEPILSLCSGTCNKLLPVERKLHAEL
jgi:hypothetical protein